MSISCYHLNVIVVIMNVIIIYSYRNSRKVHLYMVCRLCYKNSGVFCNAT